MINQSDIVTLGLLAFAFIVILVGIVGAIMTRSIKPLVDALVKLMDDRNIQNEAERRYTQSSLSVQDFIALVRSGVVVVGGMNLPVIDQAFDKAEFLDKVTDGEDNEDPHTAPTKLMDPEFKE
jgi:transcriptional regulator of nitric oxide reductase